MIFTPQKPKKRGVLRSLSDYILQVWGVVKQQSRIINPAVVWIFCLFLSVLFLLICTKSSPLYPFNDWTDANAFFTMGKGMINGKVLYRDLFEQKGPLLYFLHGLCYLISNRSFLGVFLLEVLSFSTVLFFAYKLASLFIDEKWGLCLLPLVSVGILNIGSFSHGDSAEELCLPFLIISLYNLFFYFTKIYPNPFPDRYLVFNGIIAGCVLWIKYSMLGFWFGWILSVVLCLMFHKQFRKSIKAIYLFFIGILITTIPWVLYFGINKSIVEWIDTYFLINLTNYGQQSSLFHQIGFLFETLVIRTLLNPVVDLIWIGLITFVFTKYFIKEFVNRITLILCFITLAISVYGGGRAYVYYFLIFTPFFLLGLIALAVLISQKLKAFNLNKWFPTVIISLIIGTWVPTLFFNQNIYFLQVQKEDLIQYKFSSIINQNQNATLLNYSTLDMGFYTVAGITPNVRFFEEQNLSKTMFPQNMDEQNSYIKEKLIDYVVYAIPVTSIGKEEVTPFLYQNYQLIATGIQEYENQKYEYLLYKKIE